MPMNIMRGQKTLVFSINVAPNIMRGQKTLVFSINDAPNIMRGHKTFSEKKVSLII